MGRPCIFLENRQGIWYAIRTMRERPPEESDPERRELNRKVRDLRVLDARKVRDLRMLMDVSSIISSTLDFNELMGLVMSRAKEVMRADACSILVYNSRTQRLEFDVALGSSGAGGELLKKHVTLGMGEGIAGWVAEHRQPVLVKDAASDSRFFSRADAMTGFTTKSLIAVPLAGRKGLIGVAEIMNPLGRDRFSDYDLEIFQALCRQVSVAMENAIYHQESLERERLRQELELAATIQRSFLPQDPVYEWEALRLSGITIPAKHVGGDLYDFAEAAEGNVGVLIGDISGKGVSAALFMAKAVSDFRYLMHGIDDPALVMCRMNRQMSNTPRGMFLTAIYAIADRKTGRVRISVAGHPPFLWVTADDVRVMDLGGGPPLGIMEFDYAAAELTLSPGDRLIMMTDGVFDAKNSEGARLGFEDIVAFVKEQHHGGRISELMAQHVNAFTGDADRADDLTIVELEFAG